MLLDSSVSSAARPATSPPRRAPGASVRIPAAAVHAVTFPTPFGLFSAAVDPTGAVVATGFGNLAALQRRAPSYTLLGYAPSLEPVRAQVLAWCDGRRTGFALPLAPRGTPFQRAVWTALAAIPFGSTVTYRDLAARLGRPSAARAVGRANATNPLCLLVPCHRVVGADGSLTGFAFGTDLKRRLLAHETAVAAAVRPWPPAAPGPAHS